VNNNLHFPVPFICIAEKVSSLFGKISVHKYVQLSLLLMLFQFVGIHIASAQLSSRHYLPPLKRSNGFQTIDGQAIYLSTPEANAFEVKVYQGTNTSAVATLSISNSSPSIYTPAVATGGNSNDNNTTLITSANSGIVLDMAGLKFEAPSGKKFYVNWRTSNGGQASSLVSAGEAGLGTDFRWGGTLYPYFSGATQYGNLNSVIGIMATEDNTLVNISGYDPECTFTKNGNTAGANSITDDLITITLNAGQTFVLEAQLTDPNVLPRANHRGWLGATISSNKKIAVNQGHMGLSVTTGSQDMSMTQITPSSNIGKEYAFIRGNGADIAEFPIIIATENNTAVYVNGETTPYATLNNGEWVQIPSSKYSQSGSQSPGANMYVKASKNVYAFQTIDVTYATSGTFTMDVFQVAPLNCLLDNGVNKIPSIIKTGRTSSDLSSISVMIMASSAIDPNNIAINYGAGSVNRISASDITNAKKAISGTADWVTYYVNISANVAGDVSVYAPGPVAVAYLGLSGVSGVAGYFSGFGTIPTIDVQTTGNGCFPNTTLTATPGFTSYKWYKDGVLMPSVTTNSFTPTVAGDYYVEVYNGFCSYPSATKTVFDCNPEVVVKNTASRKYLLPGQTTTFTITVKMLGGSAAQNMQISNVIPAHLTYTSSTMTTGTFSGSGSNYTWNVGTMTNGEENTLRVVATAQAVTSAYAETYTVDNTQTFGLGTEANVLADDKTEDVIIYPSCSNTLAGTISGAASYCSTTNATTLTASNAFGDLQWQSSTDNTNFTNISGSTTASLLVNNLASTTYYRMKATVDACIAYSSSASITVTQGPTGTLSSASGTDAQSICQNTAITTIRYATTNASGATFSGLPSGVTGSYASNVVTISGTPTGTGTFNYTVTLAGSCDVTLSGSIIVSNTNNTISLTSAAGTTSQSICSGSAITSITYSTTGASGASFSGLPTGVTGAWSNNVVTISGTPTVGGTFTYTVTLVGGCGSVSASGSMSIIQNTVSLTSATGTDAQTICANSAMTNLTYSTTGATGASFSGLPTGVTGSWSNNVVTISGTPTTAGNASFTITLTGGCGTVTATGSLNVNASPAVPILTVLGDGCVNKTTLSTPAGQSSYAWYNDDVTISNANSNTYSPTTAGDYKVQVTSGTCSTMSAATTISVCGVTADGRMSVLSSTTTLVSKEGAINNRNGVDDRGLILTKPFPVTANPILYLDATQSASYGGTGATWTDISGQLNHATLMGSPLFESGSFTFAADKYALTSQKITTSMSSATFIAWVNPTTSRSQDNYAGIIFSRSNKGQASTNMGINFYSNNNVGYTWGDYNWNSTLEVPKGSWSMIAITINSTKAVAYLCNSTGTSSASVDAIHNALSNLNFFIGNDPIYGTNLRAYNGKIATSMVYSTALTSTQITQIFDYQKAAFGL
jgi:uncharacterized repeat protein (TIGR01451 family)